MDDGSIFHWPKSCDETLSWMIQIWMTIFVHLVSDKKCNTANLHSPKNLRGMINNVRLTFSVGDTLPWFTINIEKDN